VSTLVIQCDSGDCWADKDNNFSATGTKLYVIDSPGVTNSNVRTWIPFTIPLRNVAIQQAYITLRPDASQTGDGTLRFSCEAADNPSTPVSGVDLNGRSLSSFQTDIAIGNWVANNEVTYQIDNPIQETLQRAGWNAGNTLAVIITDVDFGENQRSVYSYEGNASYRPYLTLNYQETIPMSGGVY
jgi:hypothetical protein